VPATQELAVALSHAIDALPDLDRDVFLLRETAGLSYEEIAAASELPLESVRSRLHRARQALRATLGHSLALREQRGVRCLPAGTRDGDDR
jgi:RNA polymerase sigma-70 factor (ECF subfamily)